MAAFQSRADLVLPLTGLRVPFHDQSDLGRRLARQVRGGPRLPPGAPGKPLSPVGTGRERLPAVAHGALGHDRRTDCRNGTRLRRRCCRRGSRRAPRGVSPKSWMIRSGTPPRARAEIGGVEHPHIGARHAGGRELRITCARHGRERRIGALLPAVRGRDERAIASGSGEDDVARLVADQQRAHDAPALARRRC